MRLMRSVSPTLPPSLKVVYPDLAIEGIPMVYELSDYTRDKPLVRETDFGRTETFVEKGIVWERFVWPGGHEMLMTAEDWRTPLATVSVLISQS
jgi:hypothetical protein